MTKPTFNAAQRRIDAFFAALEAPVLGGRNRRYPKPSKSRELSDSEVVELLQGDVEFQKYCCQLAGVLKGWGKKWTAVEVARVALGLSDERLWP